MIRNPATGLESDNPNEIKKITLKYCEELLTNRDPKEEYREDIQMKNAVHEYRMKEIVENDLQYSEEMFKKSLSIFEKKSKDKYKFILQSGESFKNALNKLYETVWNTERKLDSWRDSVLFQLIKENQMTRI